MLRIQVLGKGLIPRGYGLAPRKDPFPADLTLISTILNTGGLIVNYVNPEDGKLRSLTKANLKKVYERWSNVPVRAISAGGIINTQPHVPNQKNVQITSQANAGAPVAATNIASAPMKPTAGGIVEKKEEKVEKIVSDVVDESSVNEEKKEQHNGKFKPVNAPDNKNNNPNKK